MIEEKETISVKVKRRFKKLPFLKVLGQLSFLVFINPFLNHAAKKRIDQIIQSAGYKNELPDSKKIIQIRSVNDDSVIALIQKYAPDFVFINGTRIIRKTILEKITVPVLNIHVGLTPAYRGIHGGYWALYQKDAGNFGVTFHLVDAGVDTGTILAQQRIAPGENDTFATYPVVQFVAGLKLAETYLNTLQKTELENISAISKQHYHPAFFQYLFNRWFRGVR
jgi:folate-dependent phosphoribosylglycinamide formyltransferase PurN